MNDGSPSFAGKLLIAMPNLADPNFWRSVVLLGVHSGDQGAFGLIVNRRLDVDMREILSELGAETAADDVLPGVFAGGPVQPSHGFVLFERGEIAANAEDIAVSEEIVLSGSVETLARLTRGSERSRFFLLLGYAGWHPGQLEREIEENSWVIAPLEPSLLFDVPVEERWSEALKSIGIEPGTLVDAGSTEPS